MNPDIVVMGFLRGREMLDERGAGEGVILVYLAAAVGYRHGVDYSRRLARSILENVSTGHHLSTEGFDEALGDIYA